MVYSQTKRTSSIASITNQSTGGGSKKAGLPFLVGRSTATTIAFRGTKQTMSILSLPLVSTTGPSRPIGSRFRLNYV